jgi:hypothetical protein
VISKQDTASENLEATTENGLLQFIKEEVAGIRRICALQDLTDIMTEILQQYKLQMTLNCEHFSKLTKEKDIRKTEFHRLFEHSWKGHIRCNSDEKAQILLMAATILRKAVLDHDAVFKFDGSFPNCCEESSVLKRMKYFVNSLQDTNHRQNRRIPGRSSL